MCLPDVENEFRINSIETIQDKISSGHNRQYVGIGYYLLQLNFLILLANIGYR